MEINDANISLIVNYLQQTLSPMVNVRRPAEKYLDSLESNQNYPTLLLRLIDKTEINQVIRMSAAVTFKNYVKRNWKCDDESINKISENERNVVKSFIIGLMLKSDEVIQRQLSDAISIIGREDFPQKWPNLLSKCLTLCNNKT